MERRAVRLRGRPDQRAVPGEHQPPLINRPYCGPMSRSQNMTTMPSPPGLRRFALTLLLVASGCSNMSKPGQQSVAGMPPAPASNLPTQIRTSWREMSWRLASACSVSPRETPQRPAA